MKRFETRTWKMVLVKAPGQPTVVHWSVHDRDALTWCGNPWEKVAEGQASTEDIANACIRAIIDTLDP